MTIQLDDSWHFAANADGVEDDVPTLVEIGETQIALCRLEDGFYAISNICSHAFACFTDGLIDDGEVECPLHQARFDIRTGKVMSPPADEDLATYEVRTDGDKIYVKVP